MKSLMLILALALATVSGAQAATCEKPLDPAAAEAMAAKLLRALPTKVDGWRAGRRSKSIGAVGAPKGCPEPYAIGSYHKGDCAVFVSLYYLARGIARTRDNFSKKPYKGPRRQGKVEIFRLDVPVTRGAKETVLHEVAAFDGRVAVFFMHPKASIGACAPLDAILKIVDLQNLPTDGN